MMIFIIAIHVIVCLGLIGLVLIQRGRGSGLIESLSGVESMFGTKTNAFLARATTVLSIVFFVTCLSLAVLSVRQSKSLMRNVLPKNAPVGEALPVSQTAAPAVQETQAPAQAQSAPQAP